MFHKNSIPMYAFNSGKIEVMIYTRKGMVQNIILVFCKNFDIGHSFPFRKVLFGYSFPLKNDFINKL